MITLDDLETAIAHCQGEPAPDARTCIKLAAYYTIREAMYGPRPDEAPEYAPQYSYDPAPAQETLVNYPGSTPFAKAINGLPAVAAWDVMAELMNVLGATNQRLYDGVIRELGKIQ